MSERRLAPIDLNSYKPLRDIVFETLREAIINHVLKPGERLMEVRLAEEMGVSRTPVREAIRKLELEGLVDIVPRKGVYVAGISLKDVQEVFEVRGALEALAANLASQRITPEEIVELKKRLDREDNETKANNLPNIIRTDTEFHDLIYKAARNSRLLNSINNLREQLHRFRSASLARPGRSETALAEHQNIYEAIANRDAKLAEQLAWEHIENAKKAMLLSMKTERVYY
ncbi:MAG: GntR family transcriptional regulator [Clostridia bacterium]|mgnify:FL=1|nr:GntR family transcriptional regulator [Clostridia bacterium]